MRRPVEHLTQQIDRGDSTRLARYAGANVELSRRRQLAGGCRLERGLGRRFVLRPTALIYGRQAVAKVLPAR